MKSRISVITVLALALSGCAQSSASDKKACEEFNVLMNRAYILGEDVILNGDHYSQDLKNLVIPNAEKELSTALLKLLSIMEGTNDGSTKEALNDLSSATQILYDTCKAQGIDLTT